MDNLQDNHDKLESVSLDKLGFIQGKCTVYKHLLRESTWEGIFNGKSK